MPTPENGLRGVSLDVLPAGLIRSLEVTKTLTPDMDASSIGGTIEVKPLSAFDLPNKLLSVNLGGGYDTLAKKTGPFGDVLWADRLLNGKLGIALGTSGEKRGRRRVPRDGNPPALVVRVLPHCRSYRIVMFRL